MKDHVKNARYSNYRDIKYLGSHGLGRIVRGRQGFWSEEKARGGVGGNPPISQARGGDSPISLQLSISSTQTCWNRCMRKYSGNMILVKFIPIHQTKFIVWLNLNVKIILTFVLCSFIQFSLIFMFYCIVNSIKGIKSLPQTQLF